MDGEGKKLDRDGMIQFLSQLTRDYPIVSIEDGLDENDFDGLRSHAPIELRDGGMNRTCDVLVAAVGMEAEQRLHDSVEVTRKRHVDPDIPGLFAVFRVSVGKNRNAEVWLGLGQCQLIDDVPQSLFGGLDQAGHGTADVERDDEVDRLTLVL